MNDPTEIHVVAERLTKTHIYYECPHCYTKYKKDGTPYKKAKKVIHSHGNDTHSFDNRITTRVHHSNSSHIKTYNNVCIHITDDTLKFPEIDSPGEVSIPQLVKYLK
jgi:hypothetical protein